VIAPFDLGHYIIVQITSTTDRPYWGPNVNEWSYPGIANN